ncbi:MAG: metallophosphoesterase [Casimicrobiaceae bacterium]
MRKVLHISDLHFGRVDIAVVEGLRKSVEQLEPDVIAVSGDLTQRAKRREFMAASDFLNLLRAPKVVVPGNHDIPLYNVFARFHSPLERYRQYIGEAESVFTDDEIVVVGVNTARSLAFKGGRINLEQVRRARELFCAGDNPRVRILVTHHPFDLANVSVNADPVGRAAMALEHMRQCMPDVLLAGHMHVHQAGTTTERYDLGGRSAILVHAGTATSTRARGEQNSFNLLCVDQDSVSVWRYDWRASSSVFAPGTQYKYARVAGGWTAEES